jgi:NAD(P)H-hydrate epimerase
MKVVSASEMREIDRVTIEEIGIPSLVLMERAGLSVVKRIKERFSPDRQVVVISGSGNNGGDGLVVARNLFNEGWDVVVYLISPLQRLSKDCMSQFRICEKIALNVRIDRIPQKRELKDRIVVDAILGTGLNKPVREGIAEVIERINSVQTTVVAVDVPSGISSDTGEVMGCAVRADITVTFGLPKLGHLLYPGRSYTGELFVEDIGFPPYLLNSDRIKNELIQKGLVKDMLPLREPDAHKGTFGHVLVVGGSVGKTGAVMLTARASLKTGAGLVTIATAQKALTSIQVLEEMTLPLSDTDSGAISNEAIEEVVDFLHKKADVMAIGPGLGRDPTTLDSVIEVLRTTPVPAVVDADALYALSVMGKERLYRFLNNEIRSPLILTPHPAEMGRILGLSPKEVNTRRIELAREFSSETGMYLVLKGAPTVVAEPGGYCYINTTGSSALATAGSGDVLTGIIAGLIAQGLPPIDASLAGVYIHGLAGDIGSERLTEFSLTAGEIITYLPDAFKMLTGI